MLGLIKKTCDLVYSLLLIGPLKLGILFSGVVPIYKKEYW